ncbi:MAG: hypothetical protein ACM3TU_03595 [Bacillota bacterium]
MELNPPTGSGGIPYGHLESLLKENLELAKQNNRILRRMERNAFIGLIVKIVIWLLVLGVPIFFLSSYLTPLMAALQQQGNGTSTVPAGVFGLPSAAQFQQVLDEYKMTQQIKQ